MLTGVIDKSKEDDHDSDYQSVLLKDSVLLFASALESLANSSDPVSERLTCSDPESVSSQGDLMLQHLHSSRLEGLTRQISFTDGRRDDLRIHLVSREEGVELEIVGELSTGSREFKLEEDIREQLYFGLDHINIFVMVSAK